MTLAGQASAESRIVAELGCDHTLALTARQELLAKRDAIAARLALAEHKLARISDGLCSIDDRLRASPSPGVMATTKASSRQ